MLERLREISQRLTGASCHLGVESEVIRISKHLLEHQSRLIRPGWVSPPCPGQGLNQPERAHVERAFVVIATVVERGHALYFPVHVSSDDVHAACDVASVSVLCSDWHEVHVRSR